MCDTLIEIFLFIKTSQFTGIKVLCEKYKHANWSLFKPSTTLILQKLYFAFIIMIYMCKLTSTLLHSSFFKFYETLLVYLPYHN